MESHITISGTKAIVAAKDGKPAHTVEHRRSVELIGGLISQRAQKGRPLLVGVEGQARSGKSLLANILLHTGKGVRLVDALRFKLGPGTGPVDPKPIIRPDGQTYVIDEAEYFNQDALQEQIRANLEAGGIVVLMFQDCQDIHPLLVSDMASLTLNRTALDIIRL